MTKREEYYWFDRGFLMGFSEAILHGNPFVTEDENGSLVTLGYDRDEAPHWYVTYNGEKLWCKTDEDAITVYRKMRGGVK